jgi:ketosteroid isomerase-like protein
MTRENVERLRAGYEAFRQGGIEAIIERLAPDISVRDRESSPDRKTHHGWEGIRDLFESQMEAFVELELIPVEYIDAGDRTAVVLRQRARGRTSGAVIEAEVAHVWEFDRGTAVGMRVYAGRAKAVEALAANR